MSKRRAWYSVLTGIGVVGVALGAGTWFDRASTSLIIVALGVAAARGARS